MLPSRPCVPSYLRPNYTFLTQPELTGFKEQTNYPVGAKRERERNSSQSSGCHGHQGHFCHGRHLLTGRDLGQLEPPFSASWDGKVQDCCFGHLLLLHPSHSETEHFPKGKPWMAIQNSSMHHSSKHRARERDIRVFMRLKSP